MFLVRGFGFVGISRYKWLHGSGLTLFIAQLSGAFETVHAQQPKFYFCAHTKQKIEKHKPCPCGCNKRMKAMSKAKLLNADHPCADENESVVSPAYARWLFIRDNANLLSTRSLATGYLEVIPQLESLSIEIETPPPRI